LIVINILIRVNRRQVSPAAVLPRFDLCRFSRSALSSQSQIEWGAGVAVR
jgi:hypothetical protein